MNWHKLIWTGLALAFALIQLALLAGKLTGRIQWSWWWTLTPLWLPLAGLVVVVVLGIAFLSNASANGENPFQ